MSVVSLVRGAMKWLVRGVVDLTVVLLVFTFLPGIPPRISITSFNPPAAPRPLEGALTPNTRLDGAQRLMEGHLHGPESIASRSPDEIFISNTGGMILRVKGPTFNEYTVAATLGPGCDEPWREKVCGRPLGLRFAPNGRLMVADSYLGLFSVDVDTGEKELLVSMDEEIEGLVPMFPDDVDVDREGNVYWSDASTVAHYEDGLLESMGSPSGRIIKYDPKTKTNTVLVKDIHFANGVQLSPEQDFLLFSETFRGRINRHWLKGPRAGQTEVFVDGLPGSPDNIRSTGTGGYYVALVLLTTPGIHKMNTWLAGLPSLRKLFLRVLSVTKIIFETISRFYPSTYVDQLAYKMLSLDPRVWVGEEERKTTMVLELGADGAVVGSWQGSSGQVALVSQAERVGDYLMLGSPYTHYLGALYVGKGLQQEQLGAEVAFNDEAEEELQELREE